ncbi:hypothetical protein [Streptosporangium sp. NPDC051022]|uniref:hypothetical protein n=1 Tax=Streptosporangium sp. NPDC051022 TaxID=3155752 RepID=UPI00344A14CD
MSVSPEDAARALSDIHATQARAIRSEPFFPTWFVTGVALFATGVSFLSEPGTPPLTTGVGVVVLTAALVAMVFGLARGGRMRAHRSLITRTAMTGYLCWVLASVAVALLVALPLGTREVAYAGTYGCLAMTAFMTATSPLVARWISRRIAGAIHEGDR